MRHSLASCQRAEKLSGSPTYEATIFENCLATQEGPNDASAKGATDVGTMTVAVVQRFGCDFFRDRAIDEGQIGVLSERDSALVPEPKTGGDGLAR